MLTEWEHLASDLSHNATTIVGTAVFQHVLYDVVAVLVMQQSLRVLVHLFQQAGSLLRQTVLEDALDDSTAVRMCRQVEHLHDDDIWVKGGV